MGLDTGGSLLAASLCKVTERSWYHPSPCRAVPVTFLFSNHARSHCTVIELSTNFRPWDCYVDEKPLLIQACNSMNNNGGTPVWISHYICRQFTLYFPFLVFVPTVSVCSPCFLSLSPYLSSLTYKCKSLKRSCWRKARPPFRNANIVWFALCNLQVIIFPPILPCQLRWGIVQSKWEDLCADSSCLLKMGAIQTLLMNNPVFQCDCRINLLRAHELREISFQEWRLV